MKRAHLLKKLNWTEADFSKIRDTVRKSEEPTNGEITLAIAGESESYAFFELLAAVIAGAAVFAILLPSTDAITMLIDRLTWHDASWYVPAFFGIASFSVTGICFLLANIPAIDRLIVPKTYRKHAARRRALRYFTESGVYGTKEHSGILIFISYLEHEVLILADSGISAKIPQEKWDAIAASLAKGFAGADTVPAVIAAVETCGQLLAEHFPAEETNPDELSDDIVILEDAE